MCCTNAGSDMSIQSLRDQYATVAEVLQRAGYATGLCGKWGLGDDLPGARTGPGGARLEVFGEDQRELAFAHGEGKL